VKGRGSELRSGEAGAAPQARAGDVSLRGEVGELRSGEVGELRSGGVILRGEWRS
jgi:hypothetical protein